MRRPPFFSFFKPPNEALVFGRWGQSRKAGILEFGGLKSQKIPEIMD
jgi:hypothetical protein